MAGTLPVSASFCCSHCSLCGYFKGTDLLGDSAMADINVTIFKNGNTVCRKRKFKPAVQKRHLFYTLRRSHGLGCLVGPDGYDLVETPEDDGSTVAGGEYTYMVTSVCFIGK